MSDLRELYQEMIVDHSKRPRNFRKIPEASVAEGYNPLCGDKVTVYLKFDGEVITDVSFEGSGCAISTASASIMTESLKGRTREDAEKLFGTFHDLVTGVPHGDEDLGKMAVFSGVSEFPARVKCAVLAWHAVHSLLTNGEHVVSTEGADPAIGTADSEGATR